MSSIIDISKAVNPSDTLEIQPLRRATKPAEAYPIEALGKTIKPALDAVQSAIQAPAALCAQSFLAGAALAVQGVANLKLHGNTKPLSAYFLTITESGERKSAADGQALRPHRAWQQEAFKFHADEMKDYTIKKSVYDKEKARLLNVAKKEQINIGELTS